MRRVIRLAAGWAFVSALAPAVAAAQGDVCVRSLRPSFRLAAVACDVGRASVDVFVDRELVGTRNLTREGKLIGASWAASSADYQNFMQATMNTDPFLVFSVGGTSFTGAPMTFCFLFNLPIAVSSYGSESSSLAGTVTRTDVGPVGGTATVSPTFANVLRGVGQGGAFNLGVDLGNLGCSATTAAGFDPRSANCGFVGAASNAFAPQSFNTLQALIGFDVSAGNSGGFFGASAASYTGSLIIDAVPAPSAYALVLGALVALAGGVRLRRRAS